MENIILFIILLAIVLLAISTLLRRAGRKGCCGSAGSYKPKKKKLSHVIAVKTFQVGGMHCEKCSDRVTEVINDIPHVAAVVDLKKGLATISYEEDVPDATILARVSRAGYSITPIS